MQTEPITMHRRGEPAAQMRDCHTARWSVTDVAALLDLPLPDLLFRAQEVHRQHFDPTEIQLSTLLSIKTGGCAENCGYCSQSAHHDGRVPAEPMLDEAAVRAAAVAAKEAGATRFCMGAAWRQVRDRDLPALGRLVETVVGLGMESCLTAGMLKPHQAQVLKDAGLDYYNHNLDTDPGYYGQVVTTRSYQDRLDTLATVREAGLKVCSGGILGMGESRAQRAGLIAELANLEPYPESVPINNLVAIPGTPMEDAPPLDPIEFVRVVAAARITMPKSRIRLSAGRRELGEGVQALCFLAGANSIFYGDKLLTTGNPDFDEDRQFFQRLGLRAEAAADS
ncbi:biotin synthase BioB [Azoarcus sp. KH32C]|uniref:biotin synthase BioB n=1 Tax=Azoarcus sp. KH32C TaxID=748247 RepID=UPI0002386968|nr:biotin synthase protein [Azoarcus sp. KH32C]